MAAVHAESAGCWEFCIAFVHSNEGEAVSPPPPFAHIVEIVLVSSVTPEIRLVEWTTVLP